MSQKNFFLNVSRFDNIRIVQNISVAITYITEYFHSFGKEEWKKKWIP